jgi:hypothetical protein
MCACTYASVRMGCVMNEPMITGRQPDSGQIRLERIWTHEVRPKGELQGCSASNPTVRFPFFSPTGAGEPFSCAKTRQTH